MKGQDMNGHKINNKRSIQLNSIVNKIDKSQRISKVCKD